MAATLAVAGDPASQDLDRHWSGRFHAPGVDGEVLALAFYQGDLFAAGRFAGAGGASSARVARWDGEQWHAVGNGTNDAVHALLVYRGSLVAAGAFSRAGNQAAAGIAAWDGQAWSPLGSGVDGEVRALEIHDGLLVVGGAFESAGSLSARNVAAWDGGGWRALGAGVTGRLPHDDVRGLATYKGDLFAGGGFQQIDGLESPYLARWDGDRWWPVDAGFDHPVEVLDVHDGELICGGSFLAMDSGPAGGIAAWNGVSWRALRNDPASTLPLTLALTTYRNQLVAAGSFLEPDRDPPNRVITWNGESWTALGKGMGGGAAVRCLLEHDGGLFAGGSFSYADDRTVNGVAAFDGSSWQALGSGHGTNGDVQDFIEFQGEVYAAGEFTRAGSVGAAGVSRWDGAGWHAVGTGLQGEVRVLAEYHGQLVAGGALSLASGERAYAAQWDGSHWRQLGRPLDGFVRDLVVWRDELVAVGLFENAGGVAARGLAAWDGTRWRSLHFVPGVDVGRSSPTSLAVYQDRLLVGGHFTSVNGVVANNVVAYTGNTWEGLGFGVDEVVEDLLVVNNDVYVTGFFNYADQGRVFTPQVARWNGASWFAVGGGIDFDTPVLLDAVLRLGRFENDVVLMGRFDRVDGVEARNLARWNGVAWRAFGSGTDDTALSVLQHGRDLFVGGRFTTAGNRRARHLVRWNSEMASEVRAFTARFEATAMRLSWQLAPEATDEWTAARLLRARRWDGPFQEVSGSLQGIATSMSVVDREVDREGSWWYAVELQRHDGSWLQRGPFRIDIAGLFRTTLDWPTVQTNGDVVVRYTLAGPGGPTRLAVYDVRGRLVHTLFATVAPSGAFHAVWDRSTLAGRATRGVYFVRLQAPGGAASRKFVLLGP